jgi:hypothetical protein
MRASAALLVADVPHDAHAVDLSGRSIDLPSNSTGSRAVPGEDRGS